jgi:hypothetical protein
MRVRLAGIPTVMMRTLFRLFAAKRLFDMARGGAASSRGRGYSRTSRSAPRGGFGGFGRRSAPAPRRRFF